MQNDLLNQVSHKSPLTNSCQCLQILHVKKVAKKYLNEQVIVDQKNPKHHQCFHRVQPISIVIDIVLNFHQTIHYGKDNFKFIDFKV